MERMRSLVFTPYLEGKGPKFRLRLYDLGSEGFDRRDNRQKIGYTLVAISPDGVKTAIFRGKDFGPSLMHSTDGKETVKALMSFLCLRKGDTDAEYFDRYTLAQLAFSALHAEALDCAVRDRFGWDD